MKCIYGGANISRLNANKKYRSKNKDKIAVYSSNYYSLNKEDILNQKREYYQRKKEDKKKSSNSESENNSSSDEEILL